MAYKAIEEIGGYNIGEIVPDKKAEIWSNMYAKSPVEKIESNDNYKVEEKKPIKQKIKLTYSNLKDMTKDELNDYASDNGLKKEIKSSMSKKNMVKKILELIK